MKLSRLASISLSSVAVVVYTFGVMVGGVWAQGDLAVDSGVTEETELTADVSSESVPDFNSFGDVLQRFSERVELFLANTEEKKIELEERFAARRRAQLERLEALGDDDPRKAELIDKLEARHESHLQRIADRAERLTDRKAAILERLEEHKDKLEARKDRVLERRAERKEKREDLREKLQEKRQERREGLQDRRRELRDGLQEKRQELRDDASDARGAFRDRLQQDRLDAKEAVEANRLEAREKFTDRVNSAGEVDAARLAPLNSANVRKVQGAIDYRPSGLWEKIGYWLEGVRL